MRRAALYVSRRLPDLVMTAMAERFDLVSQPSDDPPSESALREGLRRADAAICTLTEPVTEPLIAGATALKVLANYAVGYNNIDVAAARRRGIVITNTPDVLTDATADLTWALILAVARRLVEGDRLVRSGRWTGWKPTELLGLDLVGRTIGLVGMGRIGRAVAARAAGFGMNVIYHARRPLDSDVDMGKMRAVSFDRLLSESDVISLHVPLTDSTWHLIGSAQLLRMKPTAVLINTARGSVVDEAALAEAVEAGRLAGAGLDVYEQEPGIHPRLAPLKQVVLAPHLGSATLSTRIAMGMICLRNIEAVLDGREAPNRVA